MKPIRILQVLTMMNRGGAETMIMNYYRNLDREKIQFDFLLHRDIKSAFDEEILELGGKIHRLPAISPKNYFRYRRELGAFFDAHPEYKIVHSHLNALSGIVLAVAKKKGIPIRIAHSHIAVEPYTFFKVFKKNTDVVATVKDTIQSMLAPLVPGQSTHYFTCSDKAGDWLFGKKNRNKVTTLYNAIDVDNFRYREEIGKKIKGELGIEGKKVIGNIGRLNEQKNHFFLLEIFRKVLDIQPDSVLLLVGDGHLKAPLVAYTEKLRLTENVHFLGVRSDVASVIQAFDLFLFPSLYEGLPLTLVEAQANSLPIVATDTISKEVCLTDLITFLSLKDSASHWAETVLSQLNTTRDLSNGDLVYKAYDVKENARKLQKFYLENYALCVE